MPRGALGALDLALQYLVLAPHPTDLATMRLVSHACARSVTRLAIGISMPITPFTPTTASSLSI